MLGYGGGWGCTGALLSCGYFCACSVSVRPYRHPTGLSSTIPSSPPLLRCTSWEGDQLKPETGHRTDTRDTTMSITPTRPGRLGAIISRLLTILLLLLLLHRCCCCCCWGCCVVVVAVLVVISKLIVPSCVFRALLVVSRFGFWSVELVAVQYQVYSSSSATRFVGWLLPEAASRI